ncbi:STAS domain-containing protein [Nocardioides sp. zg-DK7169]|uniref:STAS domain-containing protein n=1 Tax=Nocardioides sp. zg-DK7169 TaxID=2736600 RepID=UPI001557D979|nr:STAS domain-containing protein [Nocardioides sp. zg-DK7169]NPC96517.1 STAS domain-containing protein [Nocardioides sp. zg-DK7169]
MKFHQLTAVQHGETVALAGVIDELSIHELRTVLEHKVGKGPLVVDLSSVEHLASVGVNELVAALRRAPRDSPVTLRACQGSIAQMVLEMNGLPHTTAVPAPEDDRSRQVEAI